MKVDYSSLPTIGILLYGDNWQTPMARLLQISTSTLRQYLWGKTEILNLTWRLQNALLIQQREITNILLRMNEV